MVEPKNWCPQMIKLNRIGNKLGLAGAFGILLSGGMIVNQMTSEAAINSANARADAQQSIVKHALEANVALRRMQIAVKDIRLSSAPADVEKGSSTLAEANALGIKELDIAIGRSVNPQNKERMVNIKALAGEYSENSKELAKTQLKLFETLEKRKGFAAKWATAFSAELASPSLKDAANRFEIERGLFEANSLFNAVRASTWRFTSTGEESMKKAIEHEVAQLGDALARVRKVAGDGKLAGAIDGLATIATGIASTVAEELKLDEVKKDLIEAKTVPVAAKALELMRTAVNASEKLAEETMQEAAAELSHANRIGFIAAIAVMLSLVGSVIFTFLGVARPLTGLNGALGRMASGELNIDIPGAERGDEVGDMARTVVVIRQNAEQKARDEAEAKLTQDQRAAKQRRADMIKLADDFESAVGEIVETVSSASTELEASASTLTSTAGRAQELTTMVAAASEEASTNVQSVASATEEMTSSVNEISRQVQDSARMANEAVDQARITNDRVGELSVAASRIGDVVELINTIAGQTNLLALNATIEAARAGEAGRGFAVVASEVKALAEQTAKATGEIGQHISGIQAATQESVNAIKAISGTIEKLSEISSTIAAAVEEQGAATQEISRNVQQAAQGTQQVSAHITDVQRGASETGSASSQVLAAAQSLSGDSNRLKLQVGKFLDTVRAA
jgi:methyl-accepting chemotaxis protein